MFSAQSSQSSQVSDSKLYVDDVFSTYLYQGNDGAQTIVNGVDLATYGGLIWFKSRSGAYSHALIDSARGGTKILFANNTNAQANYSPQGVSAFNSNGFSFSPDTGTSELNYSPNTYASWTFRQADKFFYKTTVTVSGANATVNLSSLGTVGMVIVKRTDSTGTWFVWHKDAEAGKLLYFMNATSGVGTGAATTDDSISVSGTTLTLKYYASGDHCVNGTYVVYAFAHDTSADWMIQCGSFATDSSSNATVNLGGEPQFVLLKGDTASTYSGWYIQDTMRGMTCLESGYNEKKLVVNTSGAETDDAFWQLNSTGFSVVGSQTNLPASKTWFYMAIRRSNRPPTAGTQVYNAIARTGTGAAATVTGVGFAPDLMLWKRRPGNTTNGLAADRLRGFVFTEPNTTAAEQAMAAAADIVAYTMDGVNFGAPVGTWLNANGINEIQWFFRRAPGVFDVVCYTGTGSATTVAHGLGVAPELMIIKLRTPGSGGWPTYSADLGTGYYLYLNSTAAKGSTTPSRFWNLTSPTASVFSLGTDADVNTASTTYVAYLFATKAGISKVGSYTGNGSSLTLNCGFTTGARFFLCKRTDSTGDWFVWDSTRGIVASNDPHLSLNYYAAEVTGDDSVDPDNSGIIVNQNATTKINVNNATYIYLAFA